MLPRVKNLRGLRLDLLLAAVALVEGLLEVALNRAGDKLVLVPAVALIAVGTALRTRAPLGGMLACFAGLLTTNFAGQEASEAIYLPFLFLLLSVFTFSLSAGGRRLYAGVAIAWLLGILGTQTDQYDEGPADVVYVTLLVVAFPVLAGQLLRSRIRLSHALREKAVRLERDREASTRQAALDERERIASELHDVVAHALGAMTIQASAARRLAAKDAERAAAAFLAVEETGRAALTELRTLLGVLRREDEELGLAPQPSLVHVGSLVKRVRAAGLPVELSVEGTAPATVPAGIDLTAFRLLQSALGEALERGHAGRAAVHLRYEPTAVALEVTDDGTGQRRLLGIRERVQLYGGQVEAGPRRDGGHFVRARLPLEVAGA